MLSSDVLEEGKLALEMLEKQMKSHGNMIIETSTGNSIGDNNSIGSNKQSLNSERKLLDQVPRDARLQYRKGSPLGLTIEELDDRGLLDGGGAVPTYYASIKQKSRRSLEMKKRSSRLQERGKEAMAKLANGVFHVLRILSQKGLDVETLCRQLDNGGRGMVDKKQFTTMLKQIGLPYGSRELADIAYRYTVPSSDQVDIESFLRDGGMLTKNHSFHGDIIDLNTYSNVLLDVKRMLSEASNSLGKTVDDLYRMFARWDLEGTGTVTAAQFLRVLARLHVELSDQDQDILVELLDINGMGRVEFENLLNFCFGSKESTSIDGLGSPTGYTVKSFSVEDSNSAMHNETLSAISTEGGKNSNEQHSVGSNNGRRPRTASNARSPAPLQDTNDSVNSNYNLAPASFGNNKRPLTASARVSATNDNSSYTKPGGKHKESEPISGVDIPDFDANIIDDNGDDLQLTPHSYRDNGGVRDYVGGVGNTDGVIELNWYGYNGDVQDASSLNDNTLITIDQDDLYYGSPNGVMLGNEVYQSKSKGPEPREHLYLLATQTLATVREMILNRYRTGKNLKEIYLHFDRTNKTYFNAADFMQATSDLRIETSARVADIAVSLVALDGDDKVSYGEFKVFVLDSNHKALERLVQQQVGQQLERQGRQYQSWLYNIFWEEESIVHEGRLDKKSVSIVQNGLVSIAAFTTSLEKAGVKLSVQEMDRLVTRFDINGQGRCSVARFLRMIQLSEPWLHAERVLALQEEAIDEANTLRKQLKDGVIPSDLTGITEELIDMAEYLGILVISEKHLLWIASDALKAPLPVNWSMQKDSRGRTFFYNHLSNQSRWDHPLDPHFRTLRDKYRKNNEYVPDNQLVPPVHPNSFSFGGHGSQLNPPPMNVVIPKNSGRPNLSKIRPASSNASSRQRNTTESNTYNYKLFESTGIATNLSNQRPQSALAGTKAKKDSRNPPISSFNYISDSINKLVSRTGVGMPAAMDEADPKKNKYAPDSLYNAPYFQSKAMPGGTSNHRSNRAQSAGSKRQSAVDRAISYGKELVAGYLKQSNNIDTAGVDVAATKEKLIQDAYDDMVMKRLDSIILVGNTSEYSSNPKLKSNTGKGGIVII